MTGIIILIPAQGAGMSLACNRLEPRDTFLVKNSKNGFLPLTLRSGSRSDKPQHQQRRSPPSEVFSQSPSPLCPLAPLPRYHLNHLSLSISKRLYKVQPIRYAYLSVTDATFQACTIQVYLSWIGTCAYGHLRLYTSNVQCPYQLDVLRQMQVESNWKYS